ncbi:creatininase family protein [bacterium]|nr:creatininase family protein [bacterium]
MKIHIILGCAALLATAPLFAQRQPGVSSQLPIRFEELTTPDFITAVELSEGVCIVPFGILEKHGPHLPLGTDIYIARNISLQAAGREYCVVFPEYYFGQIYEAKHQPGTIAYSPETVYRLLQETCAELGRNGFKKIIIVNGHGGNRFFIHYFCQAQLAEAKDYAVIFFTPTPNPEVAEKVSGLKETVEDGHAGESETSEMLVIRPDLVHPERAREQSGENWQRLHHISDIWTGIWWYARYPNHYSGDGSYAKKEIGELIIDDSVNQLVRLIKAVKKDDEILKLQKRFFHEAEDPLNTKQQQ